MALHDDGGEEIMKFLAKFPRDGNWIFAAQLPDGIAVGDIVDFSEIAIDVTRLVFSTAEHEEMCRRTILLEHALQIAGVQTPELLRSTNLLKDCGQVGLNIWVGL